MRRKNRKEGKISNRSEEEKENRKNGILKDVKQRKICSLRNLLLLLFVIVSEGASVPPQSEIFFPQSSRRLKKTHTQKVDYLQLFRLSLSCIYVLLASVPRHSRTTDA